MEANAHYMARQRQSFIDALLDRTFLVARARFSVWDGRRCQRLCRKAGAVGLEELSYANNATKGAKAVTERANSILRLVEAKRVQVRLTVPYFLYTILGAHSKMSGSPFPPLLPALLLL